MFERTGPEVDRTHRDRFQGVEPRRRRCSADRAPTRPVERRPLRFLFVAVLLAVIGLGGCGDDQTVSSPGPAGPVGPVGSVGPTDVDDDNVVAGSGEMTTEFRPVEGFDRVMLAGQGAITLTIGDEERLSIATDANLLDLIETSVRDGVLEIRTAPGLDIAPSRSVMYDIGATDLASVEISGAGSITIDRWSTESSRVVLSGVGEIQIGSLDATTLEVDHGGVGSITIVGRVVDQIVTVSGVGDYNAGDLESATASVDASGAGAATIWVTGTLAIAASDSSSVEFFGSPDLSQQVDDLATI